MIGRAVIGSKYSRINVVPVIDSMVDVTDVSAI